MQKKDDIIKFDVNNKYYYYLPNLNQIANVDEMTYKSSRNKIMKKLENEHAFCTLNCGNLQEYEDNINNLQCLSLNLTERCNFRCSYCIFGNEYKEFRNHSNNVMDFITAKGCIDFFFKHSRKNVQISFFGGEPLLNSKVLIKSVEYIKKTYNKKVQFLLTTNGYLLNKNLIDFFKKNNFRIHISFDGPKEIHDKYRKYKNGKGTFDNIMENIKLLKSEYKSKYTDYVRFLVIFNNHESFRKIIDFFYTHKYYFSPNQFLMTELLDIKGTYYSKLNLNRNFIHNNIFDSIDHIIDQRKVSSDEKDYTYRVIFNLFSAVLNSLHNRLGNIRKNSNYAINGCCFPGKVKLFADHNGDFYVCERVSMNIGSMGKGLDLEKINRIIKTYYNSSHESCINCWLRHLCSQCFHQAFVEKKFDKKFQQDNCSTRKKSMISLFQLYAYIMEKDNSFFNNRYQNPDLME